MLLEVADGKFVGKCQEVEDAVANVVVFQVVHQMSSVSFHLLIGGHSTKNYLGEALGGKHAKADATNGPSVLYQRQCFVLGIENQTRDVFLGHSWQLVAKHVLQRDEPEHGLLGNLFRQGVGYAVKLNGIPLLLLLGTLVARRMFGQNVMRSQHLVLVLYH